MESCVLLVLSLVPVTASLSQELVMSLFLDRVEVGLCRARCSHTYTEQEEEEGQCWTVCHLLGTDPQTWTRLCQVRVLRWDF